MLYAQIGHFPQDRGKNKKYLSCHHLVIIFHLHPDFPEFKGVPFPFQNWGPKLGRKRSQEAGPQKGNSSEPTNPSVLPFLPCKMGVSCVVPPLPGCQSPPGL